MPDKAYLFRDGTGQWRWHRRSANGETVAAATEGYLRQRDAVDNYTRVSGEDAPLLENLTETEDGLD